MVGEMMIYPAIPKDISTDELPPEPLTWKGTGAERLCSSGSGPFCWLQILVNK